MESRQNKESAEPLQSNVPDSSCKCPSRGKSKSDIAIRLAEKIEKDRTVAQNTLEFYQYMAENNNIEAQFELGELYNRSDLDLYNPHEAARWYDYAAVQGHKDAFFELEDLKFDDGRYDAWV